jgi:hypothetical protein
LDIILIAYLVFTSSYCLYQIFQIDSIETSEPDGFGNQKFIANSILVKQMH